MSLKRPAAGGESCEAGFFFMRRGAQMKLLLTQRAPRTASRGNKSPLLDCAGAHIRKERGEQYEQRACENV